MFRKLMLIAFLSGAAACSPTTSRKIEVPPMTIDTAPGTCQRYRASSYDILYSTPQYALSPVGLSGRTVPEAVYALHCLSSENDVLVRLRDILRRGTLPAQLYALIALKRLDPDEFVRVSRKYRSSTVTVSAISGDMSSAQPVEVLVAAIASGNIDERLYPGWIWKRDTRGARLGRK